MLCGLASALGYTGANACLRAVSHCDAIWVSCLKAVPTVVLFGPIVLYRLLRSAERFPPRHQMTALVIAALICQLLGNVVFQWSLGVVGMALAVPLTLGTMIIGGAIMGRILLHEPVTIPMVCSMLILIAAVCLLSWGAGDAAQSSDLTRVPTSMWRVATGVGAACLSGIAYALLGVVIRYAVTDKISILMTMVTVTLTGVVALGIMSLVVGGLSVMVSTTATDLWVMLGAGVFNALAFLALSKSLQLIPVVYVNALNATQAAMAALVGILLFREPSSGWLWLGVVMTAMGLLLMRRPPRPRVVAEQITKPLRQDELMQPGVQQGT